MSSISLVLIVWLALMVTRYVLIILLVSPWVKSWFDRHSFRAWGTMVVKVRLAMIGFAVFSIVLTAQIIS